MSNSLAYTSRRVRDCASSGSPPISVVTTRIGRSSATACAERYPPDKKNPPAVNPHPMASCVSIRPISCKKTNIKKICLRQRPVPGTPPIICYLDLLKYIIVQHTIQIHHEINRCIDPPAPPGSHPGCPAGNQRAHQGAQPGPRGKPDRRPGRKGRFGLPSPLL